jgi:hypothetical protein
MALWVNGTNATLVGLTDIVEVSNCQETNSLSFIVDFNIWPIIYGACDIAAQATSIGRQIHSSDRLNSIKSNVVLDRLQRKWIPMPAFWDERLTVQ